MGVRKSRNTSQATHREKRKGKLQNNIIRREKDKGRELRIEDNKWNDTMRQNNKIKIKIK